MKNWSPLIITVAPNGARKTKIDHPAIPLSPAECAREAVVCRDAGAAMIHLHVRDGQAKHSLDGGLYRQSIDAVREAVGDDLIIQATTEAVGMYSPLEQMNMVRQVRPEAISTAVRELISDHAAEGQASEFYHWAAQEKIAVQYILYDGADVLRLADLNNRGVVPGKRLSVLYVLGRYSAGQRSEPADLIPFVNATAEADVDWCWSMCAFGHLEGACALNAATLGGHVRVGFENNMFLNDGSQATGNADLISQVKYGSDLLGRPVATASQARELFASSF